MKTFTNEIEYQSIAELIDLEQQLQSCENKKIYCATLTEKAKNSQATNEITAMLLMTTIELKDINKPQASMKILNQLKILFTLLNNEISNPKIEYPISRSQDTSFNDNFVAKILYQVKTVIDADFHGLITPVLKLTSDKKDGFEKIKLKSFFEEELNIIQGIKLVNYIALKAYYQGFADRLFKTTLT